MLFGCLSYMIFTIELNVKIVTSCAYIFPNLGAPENRQIGVVYLIHSPEISVVSHPSLSHTVYGRFAPLK